jgi:Fic family protein
MDKPHTERRLWTPDLTAFGGRRSRRKFYYDAFVPPSIAELDLPLDAEVAGVVTEAEVSVRALNSESLRLGSLEVLARQLLRAEAVASSRIEGLEMSHRRLARAAAAPQDADASARAILGNIHAMERAIEIGATAKTISPARLIELHRELFRETSDAPRAGKLRRAQNWLGGREDSPLGAVFIPPPEDRLGDLLRDLCEFVNRDDVPSVAQAALAHAQFETIHPFFDGNGRIGRCLIHIVLRRRSVAPRYVPPISLVLATSQKAYIGGLTAYRAYTAEGINSWVATFAQATRTAGERATEFAVELSRLQEVWRARARVRRRGSTADQLIAKLPAEPVMDINTAAALTGSVYEAARLAIEQLVEAQILHRVGTRERDRLYEARELFDLVDNLERRLATPPRQRRRARPVPRTRRPASAKAAPARPLVPKRDTCPVTGAACTFTPS